MFMNFNTCILRSGAVKEIFRAVFLCAAVFSFVLGNSVSAMMLPGPGEYHVVEIYLMLLSWKSWIDC